MLPIRVDRMMWTAVTNPPEWMQVVLRVGGMVMEARSDAEQYRTSYVRAQEEMIRLQAGHNSALVTYKGELQQALHEWADANDMSSNGSFADVLQEQGLEPPQARVEVDVTAFCSGRASVPAEAATDLLPEGAELDGSVEATFPFYVELKAEVTVAAGNCGCSQVNDSMVRDLLATKGVEYEDLNDFEVCCTND